MNLELVEPHPRLVLEAFRRGEFDGLEVLGQADEKAFFELCFREHLLDALAAAMPTARKKEEVPRGGGADGQSENVYDRQTPCDQDMVRKYVRDVPAPQWQDWFNGPVQAVFPR
jgi:hypothetical protein